MELSSKLMQEAVDAFCKMPGIGKKTALRLVLFLMQQDEQEVKKITDAITALKEGIRYCERCHNIADNACVPFAAILHGTILRSA